MSLHRAHVKCECVHASMCLKICFYVQGQFRIINNLMASVFVYVGKEPCLNVAATDTVITCEPPSKAPDGTDLSGKAQVQVI